jgi:hypothetical protein
VQSYSGHTALLGAGAVPSAGGPGDAGSASKYSAFNLKSYRKYFNVDTQVRGGCHPQGLWVCWGTSAPQIH